MEGAFGTLVGINTKGKDPEMIKSVIRCLGNEFNHRERGTVFLRENCKSYTECFGGIEHGVHVKGCYDMYFGILDYTDNWDGEKIAVKLFAVLNKLLGSTDVCSIYIDENFTYSDYNDSITEYMDSDSKIYEYGYGSCVDEENENVLEYINQYRKEGEKISKADFERFNTDGSYDSKAMLEFVNEGRPEDKIIKVRDDSYYDDVPYYDDNPYYYDDPYYYELSEFFDAIGRSNPAFNEWYEKQCTSESSKKIPGKYYNVSQKTKDKLIKNSTNLGYTELTAMILDKLR